MRATLQRMNGEPIMMLESNERNAKVLKKQILKLIDQIHDGTADKHLKAVGASVVWLAARGSLVPIMMSVFWLTTPHFTPVQIFDLKN